MANKVVQTSISNFTLHFYTDGEGKPRAIASRRIVSRGPLSELPEGAECLRSLVKGFSLQQGFLIDVNWLFRELPFEIAQQVLVEDEELRLPPQALPIDDVETCGIPETDRRVLWPLVRQHRGGFFVVHIDCTTEPFTWVLRESSE